MATYFVTGGTGFLGAYVIRDLLAANHRVTAFDLFPDLPMLELVAGPGPARDVRVVRGDVTLAAQLFGAVRWNQQLFGTIPDEGENLKWGNDLWRIDTALGYRFTPHAQLKVQYSFQHEENAPHDITSLFAAQFTVRF